MSSYSEFKMELLEDPVVKDAYDELQPEYDIIQAMVDACDFVGVKPHY